MCILKKKIIATNIIVIKNHKLSQNVIVSKSIQYSRRGGGGKVNFFFFSNFNFFSFVVSTYYRLAQLQ